MDRPAFRLAAPSWVMPGDIETNCRFLAGKVQEVGLLFFEAESSLTYGEKELPMSLAELPLSWHAHLPLDLPWGEGAGEEAASTALALMEKIAFLGATRAVLHPPAPDPREGGTSAHTAERAAFLLHRFADAWEKAGRNVADILLENTHDNDLTALAPVIDARGFSLCIDLGHMLAYEQTEQLLSALPKLGRTAMVHWNAPARYAGHAGGGHGPLTLLGEQEVRVARLLLERVSSGRTPMDFPVMMLELFNWEFVEQSIPLLESWINAACAEQRY